MTKRWAVLNRQLELVEYVDSDIHPMHRESKLLGIDGKPLHIFQYLEIEPWQPFEEAIFSEDEVEHKRHLEFAQSHRVMLNNLYQVNIRYLSEDRDPEKLVALSIKRIDRQAHHDWRHFQKIKNEICGPNREAIEIYPAEKRLVDTSNQYYLWVLPAGESITSDFQKDWFQAKPAR